MTSIGRLLVFGDTIQRNLRSLVPALAAAFYLPCDLISMNLQIKVRRAFTAE